MNHSIRPVQLYLKITGFLYIVLFIYTATSKIIDLEGFSLRLKRFPFISDYAVWIAWGVPLIEILIAGLYFIPKHLLTALYASATLMSMFTVYIVLVLNYSDHYPCACGGVLSSLGWKNHIIFNCVFIALALLGIFIIERNKNKNTVQ